MSKQGPRSRPKKKAKRGFKGHKAEEKRRAGRVVKEAGSDPKVHGVCLSVSQWAAESGHDRHTVSKRITDLQIQPAGTRTGYPVYRLKDLLELERKTDGGKLDPDKMSPFERQAHYKAEEARLKVDRERGELLQREDVARENARVLKAIVQELDTIVDRIERDVGASPAILDKIEEVIDAIREAIYIAIITAPDPVSAGLDLEDHPAPALVAEEPQAA